MNIKLFGISKTKSFMIIKIIVRLYSRETWFSDYFDSYFDLFDSYFDLFDSFYMH